MCSHATCRSLARWVGVFKWQSLENSEDKESFGTFTFRSFRTCMKPRIFWDQYGLRPKWAISVLGANLSIYQSINLSSIHESINVSIYPSQYLSICLSIIWSIRWDRKIYVSIYWSMYLFIYPILSLFYRVILSYFTLFYLSWLVLYTYIYIYNISPSLSLSTFYLPCLSLSI